MDARAILDNLLAGSKQATQSGMQFAEEKNLIPPAGPERNKVLKSAGTGALAAGALALLFDTRSGRRFTRKAARVSSAAAIGGLAFAAFTQWRATQQQAPVAAVPATMPGSTAGLQLDLNQFEPGKPIAELDELAGNVRSESIVQAMISAARADGHIGDEEMQKIREQIDGMGLEKDASQFLLAELNKPVDVNSIAALADTPETSAELYLASALVVDPDNSADRQYLDKLAGALNLDAQMISNLESALQG